MMGRMPKCPIPRATTSANGTRRRRISRRLGGPAGARSRHSFFRMLSSSTSPPPPALDSPQFAKAYNQVKELGEKDSTKRTAEQTQIGLFWAYDRSGMGTPMMHYNQIVHTICLQQNNTPIENARLLSLTNLAMADAGIAAWEREVQRQPLAAGGRHSPGQPRQQTARPNPMARAQPLGAPGGGSDRGFHAAVPGLHLRPRHVRRRHVSRASATSMGATECSLP